MAAADEDGFDILETDGAIVVEDHDRQLLTGRPRDDHIVLRFETSSGVVADFDLLGTDDGEDGFCARGTGSVQLGKIRIDDARVEVRSSGITVVGEDWAGSQAQVRLRLTPGAASWDGRVRMSEPLECLLTAPATLDTSLVFGVSAESGDRDGQPITATVRADDTVFEYQANGAIPVHTADGLQNLRDAARGEWAHRVRAKIDELVDEWHTLRRKQEANDHARKAVAADRHALRHAGRLRQASQPVLTMTAPAAAVATPRMPDSGAVATSTYMPERTTTSYMPASEPVQPERGYLPPPTRGADPIVEHGYLPAIDRTATENSFGRGAYLDPLPRPLPDAHPVAPPVMARPSFQPVQPESPEHDVATRVLRLRELLGAAET